MALCYTCPVILGVVFSVIVSLLTALYIIPRKFSRQSSTLYTVYMGLAIFLGAAIWYLIAWGFELRDRETLLSVWHLLSALRGVCWTTAVIFLIMAIDKIGLSKSNQWKNLQGPIACILMISFLSDVAGIKILYVVGGMLAIFVSAALFTVRAETDNKKTINIGILYAILGAVGFGLDAFLQKMLTNEGFVYSQHFYFGAAVFVTALIFYFVAKQPNQIPVQEGKFALEQQKDPNKKERFKKLKDLFKVSKQTWLPIIGGTLLCICSIFQVLANTLISGAISFSIVQLNAVWVILIGIFVFKEINFKKHWLRITAGFVFAIGAIVLLMFAL